MPLSEDLAVDAAATADLDDDGGGAFEDILAQPRRVCQREGCAARRFD